MANEFTPREQIEFWFPNSTSPDILEVSSPKDFCYNCVAWSLGIDTHWVQPNLDSSFKVEPWAVWPNKKDRGSSIDVYVNMYRGEGFVKATKASHEPGFDKIVIYWQEATRSFTHVARQMESGEWWSKLGKASDVKHKKPDTLGPVGSPGGYGGVWGYMKRPKGAASKETPLKIQIKAG